MVFRSGVSLFRLGARSRSLTSTLFSLPAVSLLAFSACDGPVNEAGTTSVSAAVKQKQPDGEELFNTAFAGTNGRSCASCHVPGEHFALTPAHVAATLASNPSDPLFNPMDADDPTAAVPSYEHLKKGLVRVTLTLPDNMDVLDPFTGAVVTRPDRTLDVWRAVPTVENAAITAPYQYDGRKGTLQQQAQGAISSHSQGPIVASADLDAIADFQKNRFTSNRAKWVAQKLEKGWPMATIDRPELKMDELTASQQRGLAIYNAACEPCHGGATTHQIVDRAVHDFAIPEVKTDGNVLYDVSVTPPVPVKAPLPNDEFLNIGTANLTYLGQLGFPGMFNATVPMPQYRYRFYTDATRTTVRADLPPVPQFDPTNPFLPATDANGAPIVGPNFLPQFWSTDPGRAIVTGDPHDFEAFDVPALRGIANSAPYFHDNSAETLRDLVNVYSRFIVQFFPMLNRPLVNPPEPGSFFPESFTPAEKDDLMAFLTIL
jgi:cytochrome c peroxidase